MAKRQILTLKPRDASTVAELTCGHSRSFGGHVYPDGGRPVIADDYDCQDGHCCVVKNVFADNP